MRRSAATATLVLLLGHWPAPAADVADAARIREAALRTYVHGMTDAIARVEVGAGAVPVLHELLVDPGFPRRDNVVAFLAYLGGDESTPHLVASLSRGALGRARPADERAALLVPEALARIAERGDSRALHALIALTRRDALDAALAPDTAIDDNLMHQAVRALGFTGATEAMARLAEIERSSKRPGDPDAALASGVSAAKAVLDPPASALPLAVASPSAGFLQDPNPDIEEAGITWANHVDLYSRVDDAEAGNVLQDASMILGNASDDNDVACCATMAASGSAGTFGAPGDGLDVIDDDIELTTVFGMPGGRVKVLLMINSCGGPGTNIIGCSFKPGNGMAVVKLGFSEDAYLWSHEYGHNVGLPHRSDPLALMYPYLAGGERISPTECAAFHAPPSQTQIALVRGGQCEFDLDHLAAQFDNCPGVTNDAQIDSDGDGLGDACEIGPTLADADGSGRVDGFDLARLGRSFGASTGNSRYDPSVDFDHSGLVDGDDLSTLAAVFGKSVP